MRLASAKHFTNGKSIVDQLVGYGILATAINQISSNEINDTDLENARDLLNKYFKKGIGPINLEGEILRNCAWYESFINMKTIPRQTPLNQVFLMCGSISGYEKHVRDNYANLLDLAAKGIAEEKEPSIFSFPIMRNLFFSIMEPAMSKSYKLSERADSYVWAGYIAIDLEKYKLENGTYPSELSDLPSELKLPRDPCSDGNILYRLDEKRAVLYSVGPNAKDDGGYKGMKNNDNRRDDIIYWERSF
ncbi:MAG: hypothetical protein K9M75_09940 [Phycisphaerae bacterium]|nr:hypothetical protein [Phycisphaerae bacterium]